MIKLDFLLRSCLSYLYGREGYLMVRFFLHLNPQDNPIKAEPVTAGSRNTQSAVRSISEPIASTIAPVTWQKAVNRGPNDAIATRVTQIASSALKKSQNCSTLSRMMHTL